MGVVALLAGATGIAFAPLWVRWSQVGPSATAFYRLLFALPVLWAWVGLEGRRTPPPSRPATRQAFGLLAAAGFFFAGDLAVWHWSIKLTSVANATLFANLAPIFVALGARLWLAEKVSGVLVLGLGLALAGGVLVAGVSLSQTVRHLVGDGLGLATALFYASYQLSIKRLRGSFSTGTIMAWSGVAACPALWLVAGLSHERLVATTATGWGVLLALALTSQVAGQGLITFASAHLPASLLSVMLLVQPPLAALLAWALLAEPVRPLQVLGGTIVLLGIGLAGWKRELEPKPGPRP